MFTLEQKAELQKLATILDVQVEALMAVIQVESNGVAGQVINGKLEPIIRYEGHYFDKLCNPSVRSAARRAKVSAPTAGTIKNPKKQIDRWALVKRAATYDRNAAYESCSYGVGQVMGSHWKKLGYKSVDGLLEDARGGLITQAKIMVKFIKTFGLDDELRNLDWSGFARGYNGKNYKANNYDTKMADAYARFGGTSVIPDNRSGYLRLGSQGAGVRDLQALLNIAGNKLNVDGDFGTATRNAVVDFQKTHKLPATGIVDPDTQAALTAVRGLTDDHPGQEAIPEIKEVQQGVGVGIGVPVVLNTLKEELTVLVQQLSPYTYFNKITEVINTGITVVTVVGLVVGIGYAVYGWRKSRKSFTGTKNDGEVVPLVPDTEVQLVLPQT